MALPENPGLAVSGSVHLCLLCFALFSFSSTPPLSDAQETISVAVLSNTQFSQIMKGEKTAAEVRPRQRSEKIAAIAELNRQPSPVDAAKRVPAPSSLLKRQEDQGPADPQEAPKPHDQSVAAPVPRPAQELKTAAAKSIAPKHAIDRPPKPHSDEEAETISSKSVLPKPPVQAAKKAEPQFRPHQLAKLLRLIKQDKQKDKTGPAAKPKSGVEPQQKFDLGDITKFLDKETPQRKQARGQALSQFASLGSPTANAAKMSPSLWGQLDGLLQEQYKRCWNFAGLGGQQKYIPEIHVQYTQEGSLIGEPVLLNPPSDPGLRGLAESAMRAVRRCDPLRIPPQYQPYYDQWKGRIVRFDPEEML
jgi:colicin import membrane protein